VKVVFRREGGVKSWWDKAEIDLRAEDMHEQGRSRQELVPLFNTMERIQPQVPKWGETKDYHTVHSVVGGGGRARRLGAPRDEGDGGSSQLSG